MSSSVASERPDWAAWTRVLSVMFRRWRHLSELPLLCGATFHLLETTYRETTSPSHPSYLTGHSQGTQIVNRVDGPNFRGPGATFRAGPARGWQLSSSCPARPTRSPGDRADPAGVRLG